MNVIYTAILVLMSFIITSCPALAMQRCIDDDSFICITEAYNGDQGTYQISNQGSARIYGFGILNSSPDPATGILGWEAQTLSPSQWNSGAATFDLRNSGAVVYQSWVTGTTESNGAYALGAFETLFGQHDTTNNDVYVNFYWNEAPFHILDNGISLSNFKFTGEATTNLNASAFGLQSVISSRFTNTSTNNTTNTNNMVASVPEPATYLMFLVGLFLLFRLKKSEQL